MWGKGFDTNFTNFRELFVGEFEGAINEGSGKAGSGLKSEIRRSEIRKKAQARNRVPTERIRISDFGIYFNERTSFWRRNQRLLTSSPTGRSGKKYEPGISSAGS